MELKGLNFIGNELSGKGKEMFNAINPANNQKILPGFHQATEEEIQVAIKKAEDAFIIYRNKSGKEKALFLETIGEEIMKLGDDLINRCCEETGLP